MSAEFYYPERGLAFFVILAITFYIVRSHKLRKLFAKQVQTNKSLDRSQTFHAPKNRFIKEIIFLLALVFISLALMRPRWGEKERRRKIQSVDLCIGVDLSQSMMAEDMSPNRLKFAKREITLLLEKLGEYRVTLIGFAGGAFIAAPLTSDLEAVADLLTPIGPDFVSLPSTYLEGALITCSEALGYDDITSRSDDDDDKTTAGVFLLVTDGDDNLDVDSDVVKGLKRKKITVNSYLIGKDQPVQIPLRDDLGNLSGFVKDPSTGAVANTKITTEKVKALADATGGKVYMANQIADFATLFRSEIKKFESKAREEGVEIEKEDQFQIPLLVAIILLFIEILLTETGEFWPILRKRMFGSNTKAVAILFVLFSSFFSQQAFAVGIVESLRNNFGVFLFNKGKFLTAQKLFEQNVESSPENKEFLFNWASNKLNKINNELQQQMADGKTDPKELAQSPLAIEGAEIAKLLKSLSAKESDPLWKKKWNYQLGNAEELSGQNGPAIDAYYDALQEPEQKEIDTSARHNLGRLLKANSQSGGSGQGGSGGGGGQGKEGSSDQNDNNQGQQKKPQDYKGQNFTPDQVKQILQNVGSEEKNVMKKKSRDEAKKRSKDWGDKSKQDRPW